MLKQTQYILNVFLFGILTLMFGFGAITNSIVFVIYYVGFLATILLLKLLNKNTQEFSDTITIFTATLLFGFILAFMVNLDFVDNGVTFLYPDQMGFFDRAYTMAFSSNSIKDVINQSYHGEYFENNTAYFIFALVSYFDKIVSGSISFLSLLYTVVYITAFIPVFLYHILKLYLPRLVSLKGSLYYALLTPIMAYSGYLLRDMHITLITMIALFWIVRKISFDKILGVGFLIPLISGIRLSNSLLILAMLGIFIFVGKSSKGVKVLFILLGSAFLLYFASDIINIVSATEGRLGRYEEFTMEAIQKSDGLARHLYGLPPIIKELAVILFTLSAFPFFGTGFSITSLPQFVMIFYNSMTNIGWFFIFFGMIYFIKPIIQKVLKMSNKTLLYLLLLFVFYMILNVNNMTFRRVLCVFPFIYIPFLIVYNEVSETKKRRFKGMTVLSGILMYVFYLFLL